MEDPDRVWANEMESRQAKGSVILTQASNEALDYITTVVENLSDTEYRRIAVDTQAVEMGIGEALINVVAPVAADMDKTLHRTLNMVERGRRKELAKMLRAIYLGRTIKNIVKEVNRGNK